MADQPDAPGPSGDGPWQDELNLARRAIQEGLLSVEAFQACYRTYQDRQAQGGSTGLGAVLVETGALKPAQLESLRASVLDVRPAAETKAYPGASPSKDEVPLQRLGPYEMFQRLGSGGMGTVYRSRHTGLDRVVALKVFSLAGAPAQALARFQREARILAQLDHPHIVHVLDVGEAEGRHYIAMELIDGEDVATMLSRGVPPLERTLPLMRDIAAAVGHVHQRGFLHRDLKPANVLVDREGRPHVTDLGLGRALGSRSGLTRDNQVMGTPHYMAPENFDDEARLNLGPAADVFSMGVMFYELLTGHRPFDKQTPVALFRQIVEEDPASPRRIDPRIPPAVEAICLKAICKDPAYRYTDGQDLAGDIDRVLRYEDVTAHGEPRLLRLRRAVRRNKLAAALILVVVLLSLTGAALGYRAWREQRLEAARHAQALKEQEELRRREIAAQEEKRRRELDQRDAAERKLEGAAQVALQGLDRDLLAKAREEVQAAVAIAPHYARAHYLHARILHRLDELEAALLAYDRALAEDPRLDLARFYSGWIQLWALNDAAAARSSFEAIAADTPLARLGKLVLDLAQGRIEGREALDLAQALEAELKLMADMHYIIGRLLAGLEFQLGEGRGRFALEQTLERWTNTALDAEQARRYFDRALELDPLHYLAAYCRAWLSLSERDFVRAEADLQAVIELNDQYAPAHLLRARLLGQQERFAEAEAAYRRARELNGPPQPLYEGLLYFAQRQFARAEEHFQHITPAKMRASGPIYTNPVLYLRIVNLAALERYDVLAELGRALERSAPEAEHEFQKDVLQLLLWDELPRMRLWALGGALPLQLPPEGKTAILRFHELVEKTPPLQRFVRPISAAERSLSHIAWHLWKAAQEVERGGPLKDKLDRASREGGVGIQLDFVLPFMIFRGRLAEQYELGSRRRLYSAEDYYSRANLYYALGRVSEAIKDLEQALPLDPRRAHVYYHAMAQCQGRAGQPKLAFLAFVYSWQHLPAALLGTVFPQYWAEALKDPDLAQMRELPEFRDLARRMQPPRAAEEPAGNGPGK